MLLIAISVVDFTKSQSFQTHVITITGFVSSEKKPFFLNIRKFRVFFKNMKNSNKPVEPKASEGKIDLTDYHGSEQSRKTIMTLNALIDSIEKNSSDNPKAKNNNASNANHENGETGIQS